MTLLRQHILTVDQFTTADIEEVFALARNLESKPNAYHTLLTGKRLACIFYEASTRTYASFIAAMSHLGGSVIPIQGVTFSSVSKGESLEDTIVTLGQYADAIVLRHFELGAAARAAAVSPVPIINAGDGIGEHPTQALIDLYTINREKGGHFGWNVAFVGDLAYGRTVHSLSKLLTRYATRFTLISPHLLRLQHEPRAAIADKIISETFVSKSLEEAHRALTEADVIYMTRVQKERFAYDSTYREVKDSCLLTDELVAALKPNARILHPLPRINEIPVSVDKDPRAAYFRQVRYGLWVRAALLHLVLRD